MIVEIPEQLGGHLAENIVHFAQFLRRAGMVVGTGQVIDAVEAVERVGVVRREDVYAALHGIFVSRRDQLELFELGFATFWRDPFSVNQELLALLPPTKLDATAKKKQVPRRLREAWQGPGSTGKRPDRPTQPRAELDMRATASAREVLRRKDFEQMSAAEIAEVKRHMARLRFPWKQVVTRRSQASRRGAQIDLRRTIRRSLRTLGNPVVLERRTPRRRNPPIVALCDVSGSMEQYSRMVLHFLHALTNDRDRVSTFVFGTRLTNITRALRHRDVDVAFALMSDEVADFSGGTRIGASLHRFNRRWARRVLGQGAVVLLITDGLERDDDPRLAEEAERLRRSCRRLVWLNPLLRYDAFEPRAAGVRALLPHVDEFRPVHNLRSLEALIVALGSTPERPPTPR
jgi:uncharacterized protein with von Willebrand factor type A (vWA) domain